MRLAAGAHMQYRSVRIVHLYICLYVFSIATSAFRAALRKLLRFRRDFYFIIFHAYFICCCSHLLLARVCVCAISFNAHQVGMRNEAFLVFTSFFPRLLCI